MSKETIEYKGFEFEYNLSYQPEEKGNLEYPGCDEDFEITDITLNGISADDLLGYGVDEFIEYVIDELKSYSPY